MRLLHTSDWHVGRTFHGRDLLAEQETVLSGLADLVADEHVDVVVVAGDLYDRAVPSGEAVETCVRVLGRLRAAGAQLVVTPGNHDSAARVGAFAEFAAAGGLHLRTRISELHQPVLIDDEHGPVACYGIPYLEPDPAKQALNATAGVAGASEVAARGHTAVLTEAMNRIRADLATRAGGTRSVVLAHGFVTGGDASDSERTIAVGGVEQVPGSVFDGVDYVALGHLHGPQRLAEHLRYSGSPLAYSFSEARQRKSVWLVDLDAPGLSNVERRELPVPRELGTVEGTLEQLLTDPEHAELADRFLSVTLTDEVRPVDAMRRLQERFPHAVHLEWKPAGGRATAELHYSEAVRGRDDVALADGFVADCRGAEPSTGERSLLAEALRAVDVAEVRE
ncbi:MAG: exonuclease SbcCD subunit D C-terminal domain-containing protein [Saccharopolyspora sp.]|uniref:exonuclease SbcCD subunit D n=1 Tax=unclassified Saccharopolyspora TaxID=2646250 RepID=UPI0025FF71DC|nr:exonuclease SbcCD subunit D C-terminal domain-containing protein [Saccharopolyspora sp.]MBQ6644195.1 exonuclease SbcCD subunit D C-terminal domain-containing protein [Saccharopolyspora sp.]